MSRYYPLATPARGEVTMVLTGATAAKLLWRKWLRTIDQPMPGSAADVTGRV
jgi:hypothetical protein